MYMAYFFSFLCNYLQFKIKGCRCLFNNEQTSSNYNIAEKSDDILLAYR